MAATSLPERGITRTVQRSRTVANADTSLEPQGLTRRVMLNILEAFFRRPWLHLLPLILMLGIGVSSVLNLQAEYQSVGSLRSTSDTVLTDVTNSANATSFGFESPASATAREVNELLRTDDFVRRIADRAEIPAVEGQEALLFAVIRASTTAFADGDNLVRISSTTDFPDLSAELASATIGSYVDYVIESTRTESTDAESFLEDLLAEDQNALTTARDNRRNFIIENNIESTEDTTLQQRLRLEELDSEVRRAENKVVETQVQYDRARGATRSAEAEINSRLRVVGEPGLGAPEPLMKQRVLTMALFGALGIILSLALVVITATLDRTIRVPNDITAKYGLEVLAVVPNMRR